MSETMDSHCSFIFDESIRVVVDTLGYQPLWRTREGDILITAQPIDHAYCAYWDSLGLGLPYMLHPRLNGRVGSFSMSVVYDKELRVILLQFLRGKRAHLEYSRFDEEVARVSRALNLDAVEYSDTEIAARFSAAYGYGPLAAFRSERIELQYDESQRSVPFILKCLKDLIAPSKAMITVINPKLIPLGFVDIIALVYSGHERSVESMLAEARQRLSPRRIHAHCR